VAPHHWPNYIHLGSGWFWHQILQQSWCKPSLFSTPRQIFHHNWEVWCLKPWSNNQLELQQWLFRHIHAWFCLKSIPSLIFHNMLHMHGQFRSLEKQLNTQPLIIPLCWMNRQQNKYKQYLELFSIKFPTSRPSQQKKQWKHAENLWTIYACILKLLYVPMQVILFFPWSQMLPTWCYLMPGVDVPHSKLSLTFPHPKALAKFKHPWSMEKQLNTQPLLIHLCWMNKQQNKYKQYLELLYITHFLLTHAAPNEISNQQAKPTEN